MRAVSELDVTISDHIPPEELAPLPARAIKSPRYDNTRMEFRAWLRTNEPRLLEYWEALGRHCPEGDDGDFFWFCVIQHERAGSAKEVA